MAINEYMQRLALEPLYTKIELDKEGGEILAKYRDEYGKNLEPIDLYCPACGSHSTFNPFTFSLSESNDKGTKHHLKINLPFYHFRFTCARDSHHQFFMNFIKVRTTIIKIGQYPSKADLDNPDWNKYSKVIPNEYLKNIKTAIGLSSHGVGAGSFVYLRRVIEYLIEEAHQKAKTASAIDEDEYQRSRVIEKIKLLKDYLPSILVENTPAYSILSKGVHELTEEECLSHFGILLTMIDMILDEKLVAFEKQKKIDAIQKGINQISTDLRKEEKPLKIEQE